MFSNVNVQNRLLILNYVLAIFIFLTVLISKKNVRGVESNVAYTIERIHSQNEALYKNPKDIPYSITQYSPLYYIVSDAFLSTLHISVKNNAYWVRFFLRLQNLLFYSLMIVMGIKLIQFVKGTEYILTKKDKGLFAVLVTVCTAPWYFITRPDVLVSLFFVSSVYYLLVGINRKNNKYIFIAGFISLLTLLSKQNGALIILFTGSFLLIKLRFRFLLYYILGIIFSVSIFAILYTLADYPIEWITVNLIKGIDNGIDIYEAINHAIIPFVSLFGFPVLIIIALIIEKQSTIKNNINLQYLSLFALAILVFSLLTSIKIGSAENYFNDFILLTILLIFSLIKKIKPNIIFLCLLFSLSLGTFHVLKYLPRSFHFTFSDKHDKELNFAKPFLEKLDDEKYFYTNIRNLMLNYPDQCVFPQYEIFITAINSKTSNSLYQDILDQVNYDKIELLIIDKNTHYLPLNLMFYEVIDEFENIKIYNKNNVKTSYKNTVSEQ